ncbi:SDR family NAD(P)-dependent oxidoreductase [Swaminathania salitolerans]|uniref:NAD(P)-dependent oxidoreductase n=1 Tax=Swaminathania salitolerans TaxID=182838 RepID=A0A511BQ09_9PROT|nr:SDR family NAD(P)-dependent oxidoreductase [Swaminathania salitolerans]GBQ11300.1 oxidoreductase [Swaminathania salitolerans LMG 21291]GEL02417.1 NAD(P)-dependent oxidoreductase [Swaminathania salitolerans]
MAIVLVTGATAGFGRAIAQRLVSEGHRVIGTGRRKARLDALRETLGEAFLPLELDMTDRTGIRSLPDTLPPEWREVAVLINNAGLALGVGKAQEADIDDWETMIDTNVSGMVEMTRAFLPGMVQRNAGYVLTIGSIAGSYPYVGGNVYGATKAFVAQFMRNLRTDLLGTAVRVTNIEPGMCGGSEFSAVRLRDEEKGRDVYKGTDPLTPEDIAATISWLVALPPHMNVNAIEMMPVCQAAGGLAVDRRRD